MSQREKKQCPLRFHQDIYVKIREKAESEGLNYQQLGDLLFGAYLKNNREVMRLVKRFAENQKDKNKKNKLSDIERDELFRLIETEYSPLGDLERTIKGIEDEQK